MHHGDHSQTGQGSAYRALAQGLGYFSIGLGLVELFAPRRLGEPLGLKGQEKLIQAYGVREIVTGVAILASKNPTPWIWARVAGDALDIAALSSGLSYGDERRRNAGLAIASVAGVTALDVICATGLQKEARAQAEAEMAPILADMRARSGYPNGREGAQVAYDEGVPPEYRIPTPLRPWDAVNDGPATSGLASPDPLVAPPQDGVVAGTSNTDLVSETEVVVEAAEEIGGQDAAGVGLARDDRQVVGIH